MFFFESDATYPKAAASLLKYMPLKHLRTLLILLAASFSLKAQDSVRALAPFNKIIASPRISVILIKGEKESIRLVCNKSSLKSKCKSPRQETSSLSRPRADRGKAGKVSERTWKRKERNLRRCQHHCVRDLQTTVKST